MFEYIILNLEYFVLVAGFIGAVGITILLTSDINFSHYFWVFIYKLEDYFLNKQDVESPQSPQFIIQAGENDEVYAYDSFGIIQAGENDEVYAYESGKKIL